MITWKTKDNEKDWKFVRESVFVEEQGFQNEFDDIDEIAKHITVYRDEELAGCIRLFAEEHWYRIGRLAVLSNQRMFGLGALLVKEAEKEIYVAGGKEIRLDAQCRVSGFYEKLGYVACGDIHMDEHVPHIEMKKLL